MSFSHNVKDQLCRTVNHSNDEMRAELSAVLGAGGFIKFGNSKPDIKLTTENAAFARRVFSLIVKLYKIHPEVTIRRSKRLKKHLTYIIGIPHNKFLDIILEDLNISVISDDIRKKRYLFFYDKFETILKKEGCKKAFLRGTFLAGGSVSDPEKTYHLELTIHSPGFVDIFKRTIESYGLNPKIILRKGSSVIYLKEGEHIVDFLNIIGAHGALLTLENIRILKQVRNSVNRLVNCETANLDKTVYASVRQVEDIKCIMRKSGIECLSNGLRQVAKLRLEFPDASLKELGQMLSPPIGKSGVNHRLNRINLIAESIRCQD